MRRIYVFIAMTIYGISGVPKYLDNKVRFLFQNGFDVFIFSALKLKNSKLIMHFNASSHISPALMYHPSYFKISEINEVLTHMLSVIGCDKEDTIYIESTSIASAEWGELLAKEINGKHVLFNLQEKHEYSEEERKFLRFKFNRKELCGIVKTSVQDMLKDKSIQFEDWMKISAYCNNVVADCEDKFSSLLLQDANLSFGSIGRLEKSCVLPLLRGIIDYCSLHEGKYNLVMIGGGTRNSVKKIRNLLEPHSNINLIITDYIYPIPRSLLRNIDVFISTAGASGASFYERRPTIRVHPIFGYSVGIMGYTFKATNSMYDPPTISLPETIEQIINEKDKIIYGDNTTDSYEEKMRTEFERQVSFFSNCGSACEYYDTSNLAPIKSLKSLIFSIMGKILGSRKMQLILNTFRTLL